MTLESSEVREALFRAHPLWARILRRVEHHALTANGLAEELEVSRAAIDRHLGRLIEAGRVIVIPAPQPGGVNRFRARLRHEPAAADARRPLARIVARLDSAAATRGAPHDGCRGPVRRHRRGGVVCVVRPHDGVALQTVRGIESRLEPRLEQRELRLASDDPYALKEFPLTRWALERRQGFLALRDASDHDPAERSVLEALDYRAVLAAGARDRTGAYLLEIYADDRTPERFGATLPLVRTLTSHAAATAD